MEEIESKIRELNEINLDELETNFHWQELINQEIQETIEAIQKEKQKLVDECFNIEFIIKASEDPKQLELLQAEESYFENLSDETENFIKFIQEAEGEDFNEDEDFLPKNNKADLPATIQNLKKSNLPSEEPENSKKIIELGSNEMKSDLNGKSSENNCSNEEKNLGEDVLSSQNSNNSLSHKIEENLLFQKKIKENLENNNQIKKKSDSKTRKIEQFSDLGNFKPKIFLKDPNSEKENINQNQKIKISRQLEYLKSFTDLEPADSFFLSETPDFSDDSDPLPKKTVCLLKFTDDLKRRVIQSYKDPNQPSRKEKFKMLENELMNVVFEFDLSTGNIIDIKSECELLKGGKLGPYMRQFIQKNFRVNEREHVKKFAEKVKNFFQKTEN